jgi:hypothetical protein
LFPSVQMPKCSFLHNQARIFDFNVTYACNGLGEYAATKLRKGDHIYVEGTLVNSLGITHFARRS